MSDDWIRQELETVNLNDKRLDERLVEILKALSEHPNVSIPEACGGHTETIAAYRFFDNEKTTFEKIIKPHNDATVNRVAEQNVVLCVQDTTELDLTRPQQQIRGSGRIGPGTNRRGVYLHLLEAFTPDGTALGAVWAKTILRADKTDVSEEINATQNRRRSILFEDKESFRQLEGYRETINLAKKIHKQHAFVLVTVSRIFSKCSKKHEAKMLTCLFVCIKIEALSKANKSLITFAVRRMKRL